MLVSINEIKVNPGRRDAEPEDIKNLANSIAELGLLNIRLHDLRHSAASNLLNMGFSIVQVQQWLGHGSASTTLNFYAHVDKNSKLDMAEAMEKALKKPRAMPEG